MELFRMTRTTLTKEIRILRDLNQILLTHDREIQEARDRSFPLACPKCSKWFGTYQQLAGQCERYEALKDDGHVHETFVCACTQKIAHVRLPLRNTSGAGLVRRNLFEKCIEVVESTWSVKNGFARNLVRRIFREEIETSVTGSGDLD